MTCVCLRTWGQHDSISIFMNNLVTSSGGDGWPEVCWINVTAALPRTAHALSRVQKEKKKRLTGPSGFLASSDMTDSLPAETQLWTWTKSTPGLMSHLSGPNRLLRCLPVVNKDTNSSENSGLVTLGAPAVVVFVGTTQAHSRLPPGPGSLLERWEISQQRR